MTTQEALGIILGRAWETLALDPEDIVLQEALEFTDDIVLAVEEFII